MSSDKVGVAHVCKKKKIALTLCCLGSFDPQKLKTNEGLLSIFKGNFDSCE